MTSPATDPSPDDALAERYGRRRTPRRGLASGLLAAAAVLAVAFVFWSTVLDRDQVTWQDHSFSVTSASEVVITFDVQLHRGADQAVCTLHALNALKSEVGLRDIEVQGDDDNRVRMTVTVPTSEEATAGEVVSCIAR
ncbi:DUF4307 domain-containing protein [Kineosporia sp. NBRC 101731]|uniref:DUF4307 domain-containing protein n=1 Tax=Kineosporia sp. NBRC 101731 TaxID=3032199 RepID=UPI0024A28931|nr:DUF4307 domain-containing protein [Kineosporia sp. NBRC 101731]GLY28622.1 hypothetical protein Kisp02_19870 [Kineosporia sp. NBRC 101731]